MRIIHAADLHLGRSLHERSLLEDQAAMLESLLAAAVDRRADLLLIAGDIYDRAIPQPEAIGLFDAFLTRVSAAAPDLVVVAIPGNHDSAARLSFGAGFLRRSGFHLRTRAEEAVEPVIVERGGDRVAVWALPYLTPGSLFGRRAAAAEEDGSEVDPPSGLRTQAELFESAMDLIGPRLRTDARNVLLAHCFAAGGVSSESERAFVGGAEEVPARLFDDFDYVALGHLHRRQGCGEKARYPGSPIAYSFSEAEASPEKGFLLVELGEGGFREEPVLVKPLHRLSRIEGSFEELSRPGAFPGQRGDFVEARLTDAFPVLDPVDPLRANFPNLLSVRQAAFELSLSHNALSATPAGEGRREGPGVVLEDFRAFHAEMLSRPPDPEAEGLFLGLLEEAAHASD